MDRLPFNCGKYRTATEWTHAGPALRIQVGLEELDDLKHDLDCGFERLCQIR